MNAASFPTIEVEEEYQLIDRSTGELQPDCQPVMREYDCVAFVRDFLSRLGDKSPSQ